MQMKRFFLTLGAISAFVIFSGAFNEIRAQETPLEVQSALDEVEKNSALSQSSASAETQDSGNAVQGEAAQPEPVVNAQPSDSSAPNLTMEKQSMMIDVLELKDMSIADVLKLISKKSGLNIVSGKNVNGRVTIYLKNIDVRDALRIILESNDLAYIEENGIIKVMAGQEFQSIYGYKFGQTLETKIIQLKYAKAEQVVPILNQIKSQIGKVSPDTLSNSVIIVDRMEKVVLMEDMIKRMDIPVVTKVFELRYSKAEEVTKKLEGLLSKDIGKIEFDKRSNKLFVTDTDQKLAEVAKMIQAFDVKHPEVLIEAKIIQIDLNDEHKMGVDWEAIVANYHTLDLVSQFSILTPTNKKGKLSIGTISNDDYTVLIEALDTVGTTNILSNPRIAVVNNEEAKILVGSNEPYVTTQTTTPASGPTTVAETVNFIEVGVKLFVTPTIHGDGYITMKIRPEVSSAANSLTTSTNNKIPIVETSQAETTVMAKDNATIVIGGLIKEENTKTINKVPLLGDVPFLGFAFRNESKKKKKTEIVIFLTPKIISGDHILEPPSLDKIKE